MADLKTQATDVDVAKWCATVEPARRREEVPVLDGLFRRATGFAPRLWGDDMLGYGVYEYTYASGRSGRWFATGFSPRKAKLSIYIMPGYGDFDPILKRLGKHTRGKSCLYVNKLADIDPAVLVELIRAGLADLATRWPVHPT